MNKKGKKRAFVCIIVISLLVSSLLFFTTADNKIFDLFLRVLPSLTESDKIFILTLDDDSINYAGGFPFRREVMADVVVLLKELGVDTIAFDLSYLDDSPERFDPSHAREVFDHLVNSDYSVNEIRESLPLLARDVDEYFAQAIAFSGNTYLTLTMFRPQDLLSQDGVAVSDKDIDLYLSEYVALNNVINAGDTKTPEMIGVMPAIQKLLSRSRGAGFVNAYPDADGLRRRVHLLLKYNGEYYGNLALVSMGERLGVSSIEVADNAVMLVKQNGETLYVPRCPDGAMLLKWPKKTFYEYNYLSLIRLIQHTVIEPVLAQNIAVMNYEGLFDFWDGDTTPFDYYAYAEDLKKNAFANNNEANPEWIIARQNFFSTMERFLNGYYEAEILAYLEDDPYAAEFVKDLFAAVRPQFERLTAIRDEMSVLRDGWCVIGSDATSMTDNGIITFQEKYPNVGTYATAANMLLSGEFVRQAPWYAGAITALVFSLLIAFLISRFDTYASIITGVSGLLILSAGSVTFFAITKIYPGFAVPLAATALTFITLMLNRFLTASHEKAFLHNAFSRYLAPDVIKEIINDPDKLNLGGEKRVMTAMFTDIKGFSTISEQIDPSQLVKLLNRYLTALSNIVMENRGTIDKYIGDAIVAFYGAPVSRPDHAVLACRSAIAMKEAEIEINRMAKEENLSPLPIFTRIGINTGEMVVGNMGAENKMDYTIMGNAVNLTARLEGTNKQYETGGIIISQYTREKIGDEFLLRRLDRVRVVGINTPLRLYELLNLYEKADTAAKNNVLLWEKAMDSYEGRQFETALKQFRSLSANNPNDKTAALYEARCMKFINNAPPADWDAVNNLTEK